MRKTRSFRYQLRRLRVGDIGWIIHRHGVLYAREYGWNQEFEALVAQVLGEFVLKNDPKCERCWIASRGKEILGSVFLVRQSTTVAKLRVLYVEPKARGNGIGSRLLNKCIRFARRAGYCKIRLWTNSVLVDARRIYERAGFQLIDEDRARMFGKMLTAQTWELKL